MGGYLRWLRRDRLRRRRRVALCALAHVSPHLGLVSMLERPLPEINCGDIAQDLLLPRATGHQKFNSEEIAEHRGFLASSRPIYSYRNLYFGTDRQQSPLIVEFFYSKPVSNILLRSPCHHGTIQGINRTQRSMES